MIDRLARVAEHTVLRFGPPLRLGPVDLTLTNRVLMLWLAAGLTVVFLSLAAHRTGVVPRGRYVNFWEALFGFVRDAIVREFMGPRGVAWTPFIVALFLFVLFANLAGLGPVPGFFTSATADINVTATLAVAVILVVIGAKIRRDGVAGFLRMFVPRGVPFWVWPLIVPIEVVSFLAKPASLAIRLFANMTAGHLVIGVFMAMTVALAQFSWTALLAPLPFLADVAMLGFEIFVALIQAFIFAALTAIYLGQALYEDH